MITSESLRSSGKTFYTPLEVGQLLHWDAQYIRTAARRNPGLLPFPTLVHGNRTQIPAQRFWQWWDSTVGPA